MYCQNCGKKLNEGVNFCDQCGKSLLSDTNNNNQQRNLTLWQDIKAFIIKHKKGIATLFIVVAVFFIVCSVTDLVQSGGYGSSGSWRGGSRGNSASGPLDLLLILISFILILLSSKLLKKK